MLTTVNDLKTDDLIVFRLTTARQIGSSRLGLNGVIDGYYLGKVKEIHIGTKVAVVTLTDGNAYQFFNLQMIEKIDESPVFQHYRKDELHNGRSID